MAYVCDRSRVRRGHATPKPRRGEGGFSLLELSIVIVIIALVAGVSIDMGLYTIEVVKEVANNHKLNVIEQALEAYRLANGRLPCPAQDNLATTNQYYGVEAANNSGTCYGGTPTASFKLNSIVEGAVPFKTLSLPEEFMYDAWGRKFAYAVNALMTEEQAMIGQSLSDMCGITVNDASGNHRTFGAVYALVSFGPDGHGGYLKDGTRYSAKSVNADELQNCDCDSSAVATTYNATYVEKAWSEDPTNSHNDYSDSVRFKERWQMMDQTDLFDGGRGGTPCPPGFRIDGSNNVSDHLQYPNVMTIGDINGDGIPDLIVASTAGGGNGFNNYNGIYVIFGTKHTGGTSTSTPWPAPPAGFNPTTLNGSNGFIISSTGLGPDGITHATIADVNGDGYGDIILGGQWNCCDTAQSFIILGGPGGCQTNTSLCNTSSPWLPSGNTLTLTNLNGRTHINGTDGYKIKLNGTTGIFNGATGFSVDGVEVGTIDETSYPSIIMVGAFSGGGPLTTDAGFVIYGRPDTGSGPNGANDNWTSTPAIIDATTLDGSTGTSTNPGFQFYSSDATLLPGHHLLPNYHSHLSITGAIGNFDGVDSDGNSYNDIIIGNDAANVAGDHGVVTATGGAVYLLYGRSRADWTTSYAGYAGKTEVIDLEQELDNGDTHGHANRATQFYLSSDGGGGAFGKTVFMSDLNNDGTQDLLVSGYWFATTAIYGNKYPGRWPKTYNVHNIASGLGFYVSESNIAPSSAGGLWARSASAYDLNGDGKTDLLLNDSNAAPGGRTGAGATYVIYQPSGGWPNVIKYSDYKWDATDSFQIWGTTTNGSCNTAQYNDAWAGDVRYNDGGKPEILMSCDNAGYSAGATAIYGIYENRGWPAVFDLSILN